MATDLPSEFDVVVLGTGLPESIIAAAFSRNGYKVLHLDRNPYYSSSWASFSLCNLEAWAKSYEKCEESKPSRDFSDQVKEDEVLISIPSHAQDISNVKIQDHVSENSSPSENISQENQCDKSLPKSEISKSQQSQCKTFNTDEKNEDINRDLTEGAGDNLSKKDTCTTNVQKDNFKEREKTDTNAESDLNKSTSLTQTAESQEESLNSSKNTKTLPESERKETLSDISSLDEQKSEQEKLETSEIISPENQSTAGKSVKDQKKRWTVSDIKKEWRKFNLDLAPKILYSTSKTVELLISSDVAKYCEFRTLSRILTFLNGQLEKVPCSRADVFGNRKVSVLEKRMLMKFLTSCAQSDEHPEFYEDFEEKPFHDFLKAKKLTANILHFVQHSIAMVTDEATTKQGMMKMKRFLGSLGRYGNTAFLFPLYGSGELPQAFCRLCAVFGGTYCLQMSASALIIKDNKCCAVISSEGQRIECKHVILGPSYAPKEYLDIKRSFISRAILLTDKSILQEETSELSLLYWIPDNDDNNKQPISILELPPSSMVCPKDMYVVHMTRPGVCDAERDFARTVKTLFDEGKDEDKPTILWSLYFTQEDFSNMKTTEKKPDNVHFMPGPGTELDMDSAVEVARQVWEAVCPEEEFLPKPPNPEDIIYVDNEETKVGEEGTGCLEDESDMIDEQSSDKCNPKENKDDVSEEFKNKCSTQTEEDNLDAEDKVKHNENESS